MSQTLFKKLAQWIHAITRNAPAQTASGSSKKRQRRRGHVARHEPRDNASSLQAGRKGGVGKGGASLRQEVPSHASDDHNVAAEFFAVGIQTGRLAGIVGSANLETLRVSVGKMVRPEGLEPSTL
ncbi:MAG: hypothetical protein NTY01_07315 [Verrucomicrobia bacterium]|nr:hypothetical protein [Verrucomicrobiota bacterium]